MPAENKVLESERKDFFWFFRDFIPIANFLEKSKVPG
jgi:hypothetical protein